MASETSKLPTKVYVVVYLATGLRESDDSAEVEGVYLTEQNAEKNAGLDGRVVECELRP